MSSSHVFLAAAIAAGCGEVDPVVHDAPVVAIDSAFGSRTNTYAKASNTGIGDFFGFSIAIAADGATIAVAAINESSSATGIDGNQADNLAINSGAVYVFHRAGAAWSQQAYIKASNAGAGDVFGASLALSADGDTLVVGADGEASGSSGINGNQIDNTAPLAGAAYVFTRSSNTWSQQAYLKASNASGGDFFGRSVAVSDDGNTLAVGANGEASNATGINGNQADNSAANTGAVYIFTRTGLAWTQQAYVKPSNAGGQFGWSVALSSNGNTAAVGAYGEASAATGINGNQLDASAATAGAVYIFVRAGTIWTEQSYLKASNTDAGDAFGNAVSLSNDGNTLAVAALHEASAATGIDGNQADNSAPNAGAVFIYTRSGVTWSQQAYLKASNTDAMDDFGNDRSVALSGDGSTLLVGASFEASAATGVDGLQSDNSAAAAGAGYVFTRAGTAWSQAAYLKAINTDGGDRLGIAVAISDSASVIALGATGEDGGTSGLGGDPADNSASNSGAVYLSE